MTIPSAYSEGQAIFTNGSTTVTGEGTAWSTVVKKYAIIWRQSDGAAAIIASDPDTAGEEPEDLSIELEFAWPHSSSPGSPATAEDYVIQNFRSGAAFAEGFTDLIDRLVGKGMGLVSSGVPNPEDGRNNDFRFDQTTDVLYVKVAGQWEEVAVQTTFDAFGSTATSPSERDQYDDESQGFTFFDEPNEEWYVKKTDDSGDWAGPFQYRGPRGGDRYDVAVWDPGKPLSAEILARFLFTTAVTFEAGLLQSQAKAQVAPDAEAVFSLKKDDVEFGTVTFAAGATEGSFAAASDTDFAQGDLLTVEAPDPADESLSGVTMTITGTRDTS